MKIKLNLLCILLILLLSACANNQNTVTDTTKATQNPAQGVVTDTTLPQNNTAENTSIEDNTTDESFKLIEEKTYDINGDKNDDTIKIYINKTVENMITLRAKINSIVKDVEIKNPFNLVDIKDMEFIKLNNNNKGILLKFYSSEIEGGLNPESSSPYLFDYSYIILGFDNDKVNVLLNTFDDKFISQNNYQISYLGNDKISFKDIATNFSAEYKAYVQEPYKNIYEAGFKDIDKYDIPEAMSQCYYYKISVLDTENDGVDEVICSKFIPGVYHNDVLGVIDYTYKLEGYEYKLEKETLWYNKLLELPLIKEMKIE